MEPIDPDGSPFWYGSNGNWPCLWVIPVKVSHLELKETTCRWCRRLLIRQDYRQNDGNDNKNGNPAQGQADVSSSALFWTASKYGRDHQIRLLTPHYPWCTILAKQVRTVICFAATNHVEAGGGEQAVKVTNAANTLCQELDMSANGGVIVFLPLKFRIAAGRPRTYTRVPFQESPCKNADTSHSRFESQQQYQ